MRRFYAAPDDCRGNEIRLSAEEAHHLERVLRLGSGDRVSVFDGCGAEYLCNVARIERRGVLLEVVGQLSDRVESPVRVALAQALAKGEKFDLIVQKATELGVSRIIPLVTEHTDVKLTSERADRRLERWKRISLEALKQCGRRRLVEFDEPLTTAQLADVFRGRPESYGRLLVCSERGGVALEAALTDRGPGDAVSAVIGPEGGWSEAELSELTAAGARLVGLGPRILRTETAALVALTLIQHAIGDVSRD